MSFVNIKQFNALKEKVGELEARIQSLEGYGEAAAVKSDESPAEPAPIPTIEKAIAEEFVSDLFELLDQPTAELLFPVYHTADAVREASDEDLQAITGIGAATVRKIRAALE